MKQLCNDCIALSACKHTFGQFYGDKSHGGVGCDHPMSEKWAEAVERVIMPIVETNKKLTQMEII